MEPCEFTQRLQKKLIKEIANDLCQQGHERTKAFKSELDDMLMQPESKYFSVEGIAVGLAVSTETVRRWIRTGSLKAVRAGRQYRIAPNDLTEFLERNRAIEAVKPSEEPSQ